MQSGEEAKNKEYKEGKVRYPEVTRVGRSTEGWSRPTNNDSPRVLMNSLCKEVKRREARTVKKDKMGCEEGMGVGRRSRGGGKGERAGNAQGSREQW